ncbi:glycosyltransferase family 25 protein [Sphingomonas naphthae]|uniref:Glycosyltransferase family 25 protein n=1 Tax=Sphingomonas naphthae TaxID=1813468 RepID=A0ABY7TLH5_9SPHN|nr:glycosyltransferase family 25 protein [Sphingomonas naphthae]WCT73240.1 glycosyltransferase family 25 protein [Sphingomonas naphthae]
MTAETPATGWTILVVSLADAGERRARITAMLERTDWPWRFLDGARSEPAAAPYDATAAMRHRGRPLTPAERGCFGSHHAAWAALIADAALSHVLVIEDDVLLDPGFDFAGLPALMTATGIDYLRLYARFSVASRRIALVGHRWLIRFRRPPYGTQCYMLSRHGAATLLAAATSVSRPIDDEMDRYWHNGLPIYALYPFPVLEMQSGSSIRATEVLPTEVSGLAHRRWQALRIAEWLKSWGCDRALRAKDRAVAAALARFQTG